MSVQSYLHLGGVHGVEAFQRHLREHQIAIPCDAEILAGSESPLAQPLSLNGVTIGNRFAIHPMEGWDGTADGSPTELTIRRWRNFGRSGAKLIWGGEAVAVLHEGRANPNQLLINEHTRDELAQLREALIDEHRQAAGSTEGLQIGLQLTHSGRYSRPNVKGRPEPRILYHHPFLDKRLGLNAGYPLLTDGDIREIIESFHRAARIAREIGFDFVDVKHCHGYLGHEFLSAHTREGDYGGSFANRTRFLREVVPYRWGFGVNAANPVEPDLTEAVRFLSLLRELGIRLVNVSAGSPYYNPHVQRPTLFPPSDGYLPPEDPLVGVARQMDAARVLKQQFPELLIVGTAYTYLQDFLPNVAQAAVREGWADSVGLGRMVLAYPELPLHVLEGRKLDRKRLCRTFSDCTTAPRNGLPSGCYPLDAHYKKSEMAITLSEIKNRYRKESAKA